MVTPHGSLTNWAINHKRWKKRLAWRLYQARDLRAAAVLHATAELEARDLRKRGLRNPIAIVSNGVAVPRPSPRPERRTAERRALFLSRINPKKGLLNLVEAWSLVRPPGWRVTIAGPDEGGHRRQVEEAIAAAGLGQVFQFVGSKIDDEKWDLFRQSDLFVLPSFSENFGLVVGEALGIGLPVVTTRATPWGELITHRCGWWVGVGAEPLAAALREATSASEEDLREMGARGQRLIAEKYSWEVAARKIHDVYEWMVGAVPRPGYVWGNSQEA
jgi:glycosyltransferase involved in cell wall biosynthesis